MDSGYSVDAGLYERDEYAWLGEQARALREGRLHDLDTHNLAEFLDDVAASQRRELVSCLEVLLMHWIKIEVRLERYTVSWFLTIKEQRNRILDLLEDAPSLRGYGEVAIAKALPRAIQHAAAETNVSVDRILARFSVAFSWTPGIILEGSLPSLPRRGKGGGLDH